MRIYSSQEDRARLALQRIAALNAEQQSIYKSGLYRTAGLTMAEKLRLEQIAREIALAQDERNRARCGAPPAPPDYDPMSDPPIVEEKFETGEKGYRKTNEDEVREMRDLYIIEQWSATQIWREFPHLKESTVRDILKNRTWHDPSYQPRKVERPRGVRDVVRSRTQIRGAES
jgi:hypothetical protein